MRTHYRGMLAGLGLVLGATTAQAQVVQSFGTGSAVTTVQATADFESTAALNDNPYVENGLRFTRTGLTFNNNGCGFAGCSSHFPFAVFSGNYMYGYGAGNGYFSILAPVGSPFQGLEFVVSTGYPQSTMDVIWDAFLNGVSVGSGAVAANVGDVVAFSSLTGFDELRYTDGISSGAPAFDMVRAQFTGAIAAPEPGTYALLATGLVALGAVARRKRSV